MAAAAALLLLVPSSVDAQQGQDGRQRPPGWPCTGKARSIDPTYIKLTEATGGHLFLADPSEVGAMAEIAAGDMRHKDSIVRVAGRLEDWLDIPIPIDSTVESLFITATVQCLQETRLSEPSGSEVHAGDAGGQEHRYISGRIIVVPRPKAGTWTLRLLGRGFYSVAAQAQSGLSIGPVAFASGRKAGLQLVTLSVSGSVQSLFLKVIAADGGLVERAPLQLDDLSRLAGEMKVPANRAYRVVVEGTDRSGVAFQRVDPRLHDGVSSGAAVTGR